HAMGPQIVADGVFACRQRHVVPGRAVAEGRAARIEGHARGPADRRLHIGPVEAHAHLRQTVNIWRLQRPVPLMGQVIPSQLVAHDEQYVADHIKPHLSSCRFTYLMYRYYGKASSISPKRGNKTNFACGISVNMHTYVHGLLHALSTRETPSREDIRLRIQNV